MGHGLALKKKGSFTDDFVGAVEQDHAVDPDGVGQGRSCRGRRPGHVTREG